MKIGFLGLLQILFITLKLLGKVEWSWWWVLAPACVSVILSCLTLVIVAYAEAKRERKLQEENTEFQRKIAKAAEKIKEEVPDA